MTSASAPGKIILFGEHAVVYGRPALAVPVMQVQAQVSVTAPLPDPFRNSSTAATILIEASDIGLAASLNELLAQTRPHPLAYAVSAVLADLKIVQPPPMTIRITSTIPVASGLGSGAAVSVAIMRAVSTYLGQPLPDDRISALAFEVEKLHHGTPSGIDNTVITYAAPVYFVKGQPVEIFHPAWPFTIVIADTGISAFTKASVGDVRRLWEADPANLNKIFDRIGGIVDKARRLIETGQVEALGPLMDENHSLLQALTVSSPALDRLVLAARHAGALGAKLSGGGRGGNMIALAGMENAPGVAEALIAGGAKRTIVTQVGVS